jgi:hemoglobin
MPAGSNKADINTRKDLEKLISLFYDKLLADTEIGHFFVKLNLSTHLPLVVDFWAFIVLNEPGYKRNMMEAHAPLNLKQSDFDRWYALFSESIDENFQGEKATLMKTRAQLIGWTMFSK